MAKCTKCLFFNYNLDYSKWDLSYKISVYIFNNHTIADVIFIEGHDEIRQGDIFEGTII